MVLDSRSFAVYTLHDATVGDKALHTQRKQQHLDICLHEDVRSALTTGLERYRLVHQALPEMALADVDTRVEFLGHPLSAPILISSMTGGAERAYTINRRLAAAAQELGLAMGVGSQRVGIEDPAQMESFHIRDVAPNILLFANLGAVQLNYGYGVEECRAAIESIGADGLILHINPLQEAVQPEGDTDYRHLAEKIADVCAALPYPVIVKEVGWGLSPQVARRLCDAGVAALDVAGAGGTSWSEVERYRATTPAEAEVAAAFIGWGIPTAESLVAVRRECPRLPLIASGGITSGIDAAICLALGAGLVGLARHLLAPAVESTEATLERLTVIVRQLRIAMFCSGARTVADLDETRLTT
jgi:isopentenyl-diphosphate delta-isomerase